MSDCFDHELEAFESYDRAFEDPEGGYLDYEPFRRDPFYYHKKVRFNRLVLSTDRAYLIEVLDGSRYWVPSSLCRQLDVATGTVWIYRPFWRNREPVAAKADFF